MTGTRQKKNLSLYVVDLNTVMDVPNLPDNSIDKTSGQGKSFIPMSIQMPLPITFQGVAQTQAKEKRHIGSYSQNRQVSSSVAG